MPQHGRMGPEKGTPYMPLMYPVQIKGPYIRTLLKGG